MRITVLGKSPSWQDAGGACSGYLVQEAATTVLLDCGNGVFGKLRRVCDYTTIDAVVVTHLHADHFLDLVPYAYALTYGPRQQRRGNPSRPEAREPARPLLHAPLGARETFRRVVGAWGNEDLIERAFELREYEPVSMLIVGDLRVRLAPVPHFTPTHAAEFQALGGGARFTFGADSGPSQELVAFAQGTDLLMVEATLPQPEPEGQRGHLTPGEAGDHGRRSAAQRLVLTHISDELDLGWAHDEAQRAFGGPVEIATEGAVYRVG